MPRDPKYYTYNKKHNLYQVKKRINGKWEYFGYYKTEEEAKQVVSELKKVDWNVELLSDDVKALIKPEVKNYSKLNTGKYLITKTCDYTQHNYGCYDTEEEAAKIKDLLEENNWRLSNLSEEELNLIKLNKLQEHKYYSYNNRNDVWVVKKDCYYGSYKDEETAARVVDALKKVNWDKDKCSLVDELKIKRPRAKYYSYNKRSGKYQITKTINGKLISFGYYETEAQAKHAVDLLKQNNWNRECLT